MFLSIIIPTYNEEKRLSRALEDIEQWEKRQRDEIEVIVVDDGSRDGTVQIAERFKKRIRNLSVIDNKENHGKGWVVRQGILGAKGEWRLFTDADDATSINHFDKMRPLLRSYDVIICSRDVKGARLVPAQPWYRRLLGNIGNLVIQGMLLPGIWDTQCGFKCFSADAAKSVFKSARIDRWGFDIEALVLAKRFGFRIREIPAVWKNDLSSRVGISAYFSTLREVFKIRWWLWRRMYPGKEEIIEKIR